MGLISSAFCFIPDTLCKEQAKKQHPEWRCTGKQIQGPEKQSCLDIYARNFVQTHR